MLNRRLFNALLLLQKLHILQIFFDLNSKNDQFCNPVRSSYGSSVSLEGRPSSPSALAVGWLYVKKRDVGVIVQKQGVLLFVDLRDQILVSKVTIGKDPIVATLFIKHENRVRFQRLTDVHVFDVSEKLYSIKLFKKTMNSF